LINQIQLYFDKIEKSLEKLDSIYQDIFKNEVLSLEMFYKIYSKVKKFNYIINLHIDEIKNISIKDGKINITRLIDIINCFKTEDVRKDFIEKEYIHKYINDILEIKFIIDKDKNNQEDFIKTLSPKIKSCIIYFWKFSIKDEYNKINQYLNGKVLEFNEDLEKFDINVPENFTENKLNEMNIKILVLLEISKTFISLNDSFQIQDLNLSIHEFIDKFKRDLLEKFKLEKKNNFSTDENNKKINLKLICDSIIKIKKISVNLKYFGKEVEEIIVDYIEEFKHNSQKIDIFSRLGILLQDNEKYGCDIINEFKVFEGFQNQVFMSLTKKFSIDFILDNLKIMKMSEEYEFKDEYNSDFKKILKNKYKEYFKEFKNLIEENLENSEKGMEKIKNKLKIFIADNLQMDRKEKTIINDIYIKLPQILAQVCAIFTLNRSKNYYNVDETKFEDKNLLIPHPAQIIAIFQIFCLETKKNLNVKNNLIQVGTGEGKSIILGLTSIIFALINYDVSVACFSNVLSIRDYEAFKDLFDFFGVTNSIQYGSFNNILEKLINKNINIKNYISDTIFDKSNNEKAQKGTSEKFNILLFDEVDIFFSKEFHGKLYTSSLIYKNKAITDLFMLIWNIRKTPMDLLISSIRDTDEFTKCKELFNDYDQLLEEQLKDILNDLDNFESHQYFVLNNKIGYKENNEIIYNLRYGYKTIFAYFKEHEIGKITKESLEENIGLNIKCTDFSYSEIPKLFDYKFGVSATVETLGENQKKMIANEYGIKKYSIIPSVFGKNNLQFNKFVNFFIEDDESNKEDKTVDSIDIGSTDNEIKQTDKIIYKQKIRDNEYYYRIKEEIKNNLVGNKSEEKNRAVLVFFKDIHRLYNFINLNNLIQSDFNIIVETIKDEEVHEAIKKACRRGVVTLLTSSFGRGFDFIVKDKILKAQGGLHIIQTFLSEDMAEQIQIMGRTARQGDYGSYSLIIKYDELKNKFNISKETLESQNCKYEYVMNTRENMNEIIFKNNLDIIEKVNERHLDSMNLIENIKKVNKEEIKNHILKFNKGVNLSPFVARTKIYIDATSSMEILIEKLKLVIIIIFKKLTEILRNNHIRENSFSVQIILFRNYDVSKEEILVPSGWEMKFDNLTKFLNESQCKGGWEKEAIELCLNDAVKESKKLTNIIIFSDSASNNKKLTFLKRSSLQDTYTQNGMNPSEYWNNTEFKNVLDVDEELEKFKEKKIPIYGFYVLNENKQLKDKLDAEAFFRKITNKTNGIFEKVNLEQENEADRLAKLISEPIIKAIGEHHDDEVLKKLIADFEKQYI